MSNALEIKHLNKSFGGVKVTQDLSLTVKPGERRLIIGPNGAGKTTLFNQISGELASDSGTIAVFGRDLTKSPAHLRAHVGASRTYQIITLFPKNTLAHNVALAMLGTSKRKWEALKKLQLNDPIYLRALELLDQVGLKHRADMLISEISYGEQRRVEIALAMSQNPSLLLLDEPLAGLSIDERMIVRDLISAIPKTTTIIMIEHDMDVALSFAETISVLHYGSLIVEGDRDFVVNHPRTREVYLGH